jgi:hypothetical protein
MLDNRNFWLAGMIALGLLYLAAAVLVVQGQAAHVVVRLAWIILAVHVLELPIAFHQLKGRNAQLLRVVVATLLFGALWWMPARRGLVKLA